MFFTLGHVRLFRTEFFLCSVTSYCESTLTAEFLVKKRHAPFRNKRKTDREKTLLPKVLGGYPDK